VTTFYELLSVVPTATAEEIKRAFRAEIARYHPDKVQHLGKEFQQMAAGRAAALTEAYRTLMNPQLRAEYDEIHVRGVSVPPAAGSPAADPAPPASTSSTSSGFPGSTTASATEMPPSVDVEAAKSARFANERRARDSFVRNAIVEKFRKAVSAEIGEFEESSRKGFDFECATKARRLFSRSGAQRFVVRFVPKVDRAAIQDVWIAAAQRTDAPVCVFLIGNGVSPAAELAEAIGEMRKKSRASNAISVIPVDVRDWSAHMPVDAPAACKNVLQRLRDTA
jgi:curved DNA-binding protein CbpA